MARTKERLVELLGVVQSAATVAGVNGETLQYRVDESGSGTSQWKQSWVNGHMDLATQTLNDYNG